MVFIWVFLAIGVVLGVAIALDVWEDSSKSSVLDYFTTSLFSIIICCLVSGVLVGLGFGVAVGVGHVFPAPYTLNGEWQVKALQDTDGVERSFFIGSGYIHSQLSYVAYYKHDDGIKLIQLSQYSTTVYEEEREDAILVQHGKDNVRAFGIEFAGVQSEFRVPQGTVLRGYQLDLQ